VRVFACAFFSLWCNTLLRQSVGMVPDQALAFMQELSARAKREVT